MSSMGLGLEGWVETTFLEATRVKEFGISHKGKGKPTSKEYMAIYVLRRSLFDLGGWCANHGHYLLSSIDRVCFPSPQV